AWDKASGPTRRGSAPIPWRERRQPAFCSSCVPRAGPATRTLARAPGARGLFHLRSESGLKLTKRGVVSVMPCVPVGRERGRMSRQIGEYRKVGELGKEPRTLVSGAPRLLTCAALCLDQSIGARVGRSGRVQSAGHP